jgi:two-component system sensor histidine kinase TtrS
MLAWSELKQAVEDGEVDFVIASPVFNVELGMEEQLTVIATLRRENEKMEAFDNLFGSVIFWRADNKDIKSLWDLRNKTIAAGAINSIGGWLAPAREFAERGIDLRNAARKVNHFIDNNKIIDEVMSGRADFGICRTSSLELLATAGKFNMSDIIYSRELYLHTEDLPFACSTRLYPEWSFARVAHTPANLVEKVALNLLRMSNVDDPKKITWGFPANYAQVHLMMKTLNLEPFFSENSLINLVIKRMRRWLTGLIITMLVLGLLVFYLLRLNFKLHNVTQEHGGRHQWQIRCRNIRQHAAFPRYSQPARRQIERSETCQRNRNSWRKHDIWRNHQGILPAAWSAGTGHDRHNSRHFSQLQGPAGSGTAGKAHFRHCRSGSPYCWLRIIGR